jgi:hypothetical protein
MLRWPPWESATTCFGALRAWCYFGVMDLAMIEAAFDDLELKNKVDTLRPPFWRNPSTEVEHLLVLVENPPGTVRCYLEPQRNHHLHFFK